MSTVIYSSPIYGPVHSRRLGLSLGINLMPADGKVCTFDCIYCECGFNRDNIAHMPRPTREEVRARLGEKLSAMHIAGNDPDVLTFAGNGEPTLHPHFADIVDDTLSLRDRYCPAAKVSVLSNATCLARPGVVEALKRVDNNILKLDTVSAEYIARVDRPVLPGYDVKRVIEQLKAFNGQVIIQTMFLRGQDVEGRDADNTGEEYVGPYLEALAKIKPREVMIYTIDRETPDHNLLKATPEQLRAIQQRIEQAGFACTASY